LAIARENPLLGKLIGMGKSAAFGRYAELLTEKAIEYAELEEWAFKRTQNFDELSK